jgi:hypothetical protein
MDPTSPFLARSDRGGFTFSSGSLFNALAEAVADFVSTHYDLPRSIECKLLLRGWNDTFEVRTKDAERFRFSYFKTTRAR